MKKLQIFTALCFLLAVACNPVKQGLEKGTGSLSQAPGVRNSVLLFNNSRQTIPLKNLDTRKIASVNFGSAYASAFDSLLKKYTAIQAFDVRDYSSKTLTINELSQDLKLYNTIIVQADPSMPEEQLDFILRNSRIKDVIVAGLGDLQDLKMLDSAPVPIVWSSENSSAEAQHEAQLIFGGIAASNQLNETVSSNFKAGSAYKTVKTRIGYLNPAQAGISSNALDSIDLIAAEAIREKATPSAVVLVIKDGNVIFNKAYGSHTYDGRERTSVSDIYDLASLTKVSATTMSVMRLFEQKKINLDEPLSTYLPTTLNTNKADILVRDVMLHQSGVTGVGFHNNIKPENHSADSSYNFPTKVSENYYLRRNYFRDFMLPAILRSPLNNPGTYRYTDINMYIMREIVEMQSSVPINIYVLNEFYRPLGMQTAGYNPLWRFPKEQIVPTEQETRFRQTLLHGIVHDEGAAMLGGVSGHAGLFASATDLGILYQMLLNGGTYGGTEYFTPETVRLFTSKQSAVSRRGFGFDRGDPDPAKRYGIIQSKYASAETFGHTGFTGTCVWVDPKYKLVYVFLSNRVHPTRSPKLDQLKIRQRIQDAVYRAIGAM